MKKITTLSLVLILIFALFATISCQQEPVEKEVVKEVTVTNWPTATIEKSFPAPASVRIITPDPDDSSKLRLIWTIVPDAESYMFYLKDDYGFIKIAEPINSWKHTSNYRSSKEIYTQIDGNRLIALNVVSNILGIKAISIDGISSSITWWASN